MKRQAFVHPFTFCLCAFLLSPATPVQATNLLTSTSTLFRTEHRALASNLLCRRQDLVHTPSGVSETDKKADFAYLDTLGFQSLFTKRFVVIRPSELRPTVGKDTVGGDIRQNTYGFLVRVSATEIQFLNFDLQLQTIRNKPSQRVRVESADLATVLNAALEPTFLTYPPLTQTVMAKLSEHLGNESLARKLLQLASEQTRHKSLLDSLKEIAGFMAFNDAEYDIFSGVAWSTVRRRCEAYLLQFADGEYADEARKIIRDVDRRSASSLPSKADPASRYLGQLREEIGSENFQVGKDQVGSPKGASKPSDALMRMGWSAIPALINRLGDSTLVRLKSDDEDSLSRPIAPRVLRMKEVALRLLDAIVCGSVENGVANSSDQAATDEQIQDSARKWWHSNQPKGFIAVLRENMSRGWEAADALALRFPLQAPSVLRAAIAQCAEPNLRVQWISAISKLPKAAGIGLALQIAKNDPDAEVRAAAIDSLSDFGSEAVVPLMIASWEEASRAKTYSGAASQLIKSMSSTHRSAAIDALGRGLRRKPLWIRGSVVGRFLGGFEPRTDASREEVLAEVEPAALAHLRKSVERLLLAELDDSEPDPEPLILVEFGVEKPRVCDVAARALSDWFPTKYPFQPLLEIKARNALIARFRQTYAAGGRG